MRRLLLPAVVLLIVVGALGSWWLSRPSPGPSVFAKYVPQSLGKIWTITGSPGSPYLAFADPTGGIQPRRDAYSVHCFIFDRDQNQLYSPLLGNVRALATLADGLAPCVTWQIGSVHYSQTTFASADTCYSSVVIWNESQEVRRVAVFAAAVPYQVIGPMQFGHDVTYDAESRSIVVDGTVLLTSDTEPGGGAAMSGEEGADITGYLRKGVLPRGSMLFGKHAGLASGAMRFDLELKPGARTEVCLRLPLTRMTADEWNRLPHASAGDALDEYGRRWRQRLGRVGLQVPDKRVSDCFTASLAYLLMLSGDGKPMPGAAKYRAFWVRDAAYMADALYYSGQHELVPKTLAEMGAMQLPNGGFRPKTGAGEDDELDAPGEAIYAWVQQYRRTLDTKSLAGAWPRILSACRFIREERVKGGGILPASVSAEDLGPGDQRHYWDDFWCVRGLRDAAFAAKELAKPEDAAWIVAEADSLLRATQASVRKDMARHSIGFIPNGPEDVTSSAMARGTSCALWPCAVLDPADALTKRSFDVYWDKWIAPSAGGFLHKEHYWPYAGLDLAQGYLMLGQRERAWTMLDWTLRHDPTRGFYSWPEGMSKADLTLAEGDMPHGWMCAGYVSLVRNMLVRESGRDLVLLSGVPKQWLRPGARIGISEFPTQFGNVGFQVEVVGKALKVWLSGARPPGVYKIALPGGAVAVPPGTRQLTITL